MRIFLCVSHDELAIKALDSVKAPNRLYSFSNEWENPFTRENVKEMIHRLADVRGNAELVMIDSGVAAYNRKYFNREVIRKWGRHPFTESEVEELVEKYRRYLEICAKTKLADVAVEMDVDHFVGYKRVCEYRKMLQDTGMKIIPVWRPSIGKEEYFKLIEEHDWIALSEGFVGVSINATKIRDAFKKMVYAGVKRGKRYHFFAGLRREMLFGTPFYSSDSTSWTSYNLWALTTVFEPKELWISGGPAGEGLPWFGHPRQIGAVEDIPFNPKDSAYMLAVAAKSYMELEKVVTKYWERVGIEFDDSWLYQNKEVSNGKKSGRVST